MTEATPTSIVQRLGDFILANPPYKAVDDTTRMESVEALLDMNDGWPADYRDGFGIKTDHRGTSQTWTVNAGDLMLLVWLLAKNKREVAAEIERLQSELNTALERVKVLEDGQHLRELADFLDEAAGRLWCAFVDKDWDAVNAVKRDLRPSEPKSVNRVRAVLQSSGGK